MNWIKKIRETKNITQSDLAKRVNLSVLTISRYENHLREPRASDIQKLCEVLGVTEAELLNGPANDGEVKFTIIWEKVSDMSGMEARMNEFKIGSGDEDAFGCFRFSKDIDVEEIGKKFMNELKAARVGWQARDEARKKLEA